MEQSEAEHPEGRVAIRVTEPTILTEAMLSEALTPFAIRWTRCGRRRSCDRARTPDAPGMFGRPVLHSARCTASAAFERSATSGLASRGGVMLYRDSIDRISARTSASC